MNKIVIILIISILTACDNFNENGHSHEWGNWIISTEPTCTVEGLETRVCLLDSTHTETRYLPPQHKWANWITNSYATCIEEGSETGVCSFNAEHTITRSIPINETAHYWNNWFISKNATCTTDGEETRTCTRSFLHNEKRIILKTSSGHNWYWETINAATQSTDGEETRTCSICTENQTRTAHATGTYGLSFTLINYNTAWGETPDAYSVRAGIVTSGVVYIPSYRLNNDTYLPVVQIYYDAFQSTDITAVHILDGISLIGESAFSYCKNLQVISIPESVTSIVGWTFQGCTSLNNVIIPSKVTAIGNGMFYSCTSLTSIVIPANVTSIGNQAFLDCTNLISVTFESTLTASSFSSTSPFPGDLRNKYLEGGTGTYTRLIYSNTWTKQ
jgi:hypothetical protein